MARFLMTALLILAFGCCGDANALSLRQQRGLALVEKMCARCHAVGRNGASPHPGAPPFRELDRRIDLDAFIGRLRNGLASGHPDMPMFRFSREDAKAVIAYLRAIQGP